MQPKRAAEHVAPAADQSRPSADGADAQTALPDLPAPELLAALGHVVWSLNLPMFDDLRLSPTVEKLTGYRAEDFSRQRGLFRSLIPCEDHPLFDDAVRQAMRDGRAVAHFRLRRADGAMRRMRGEGVVQRDAHGRPCRLVGLLADVTGESPDPAVLRSGDGFYRTIVDDIREAIVRLGPDMTVTYCNRWFAALCNAEPADLTGRQLLDVVRPELRDAAAAMMAQLTPTNPVAVEEFERPGPDGRPLWIRWSSRAIVNDAGEITEYQGVGHDISDLKNLQRTLTEQHERLALAVQCTGAGICDSTIYPTEDGRFDLQRSRRDNWVSPSWRTLFGFSADDPAPEFKDFTPLLAPGEAERVGTKLKAFFANPVGFHHDIVRFRRKDGRPIVVETCFAAGHPRVPGTLRLVVAATDISELKQAEQRLQDAIETLEEGFILLDKEMRIIEVNHRFRELYDISGHLAQPGASYVDFLRYGAMNGQYARGVGRGEAYFNEIMENYRTQDATQIEVPLANGRWLLLSQRRTADGGWVGVRVDLTAQKAREVELERARDRLTAQARDLAELARRYEDANRTKSRFLAHMSHELRTPLNAILGFTELMRAPGVVRVDAARQRDYTDMIHQGGSHLLALINDILDLSRVESGRVELVHEPIALKSLLLECLTLVDAESGDRNIALRTVVEDDCQELVCDRRTLKQITVNLLSNALKFTCDGGRVQATWRRVPSGAAELMVEDTGIGMTEDEVAIALDPFGQIDSVIARKHQGTGLGLPLVKALAESLGGRLSIVSEPGRGTTVTVQLPDSPQRSAEATAAAAIA